AVGLAVVLAVLEEDAVAEAAERLGARRGLLADVQAVARASDLQERPRDRALDERVLVPGHAVGHARQRVDGSIAGVVDHGLDVEQAIFRRRSAKIREADEPVAARWYWLEDGRDPGKRPRALHLAGGVRERVVRVVGVRVALRRIDGADNQSPRLIDSDNVLPDHGRLVELGLVDD